MRQIVLDTETTGLDYKSGHRVIEIGCVELVNRRFTGNKFHEYINPEREVEDEALGVHGISNEFLQDKPLFAAVAESFIQFVDGAEIIAHNASFDVGFLNNELRLTRSKLGKLEKHCEIFDTLKLARQLHPGQRNSLDALTKRYAVDKIDRELHGALLDAEILAHVYLAMTGGQGSLFAEEAGNAQSNGANEQKSTRKYQATRVIAANAAELKAHEEFLEMLEKS